MFKKNQIRAGRKSKPKPRKRLAEEIYEITSKERVAAVNRQQKAGITPVRTRFKPASELPTEINAALDKIWTAGSLSDGKTDQVLRLLYAQISRGLTCLSQEDLLAIARLKPAEIQALAPWLTQGKPLDRAQWAVRQEQEKK